MYVGLRKVFLVNNPRCEICGVPSSEVHHKRGRFGDRLNDDNFFMSVCRSCHNWIHRNPLEAYAKEYLVTR